MFHRLADLMQEWVEPDHARFVEQAAVLADELPELGARDLLHAAILRRLGVQRIISADAASPVSPKSNV